MKIDPKLNCQRLITIGERCEDDLESLFKFEPCRHPASLFEASFLPLQANKAALAALWKAAEGEQHKANLPESIVQFVLAGGVLLQHLHWPRGSTFDTV